VISLFVCVYVHFSAGVILPCYDSTQNVKDTNQKRKYFHFFSNFFGVLFSAAARVQLCVKPSKILEGRLFHAEVTSFNKQTLVLKCEFRYVFSPPHSVSVVTSGTPHSGGESPRLGHVEVASSKLPDTCGWEQVRVGRNL
jgi:hypothetical protein